MVTSVGVFSYNCLILLLCRVYGVAQKRFIWKPIPLKTWARSFPLFLRIGAFNREAFQWLIGGKKKPLSVVFFLIAFAYFAKIYFNCMMGISGEIQSLVGVFQKKLPNYFFPKPYPGSSLKNYWNEFPYIVEKLMTPEDRDQVIHRIFQANWIKTFERLIEKKKFHAAEPCLSILQDARLCEEKFCVPQGDRNKIPFYAYELYNWGKKFPLFLFSALRHNQVDFLKTHPHTRFDKLNTNYKTVTILELNIDQGEKKFIPFLLAFGKEAYLTLDGQESLRKTIEKIDDEEIKEIIQNPVSHIPKHLMSLMQEGIAESEKDDRLIPHAIKESALGEKLRVPKDIALLISEFTVQLFKIEGTRFAWQNKLPSLFSPQNSS